MPSHPLLNFEIERYYRIENRFNNVYSRNNLPEKIKDGGLCGKPWWICRRRHALVALFCNRSEILFFG